MAPSRLALRLIERSLRRDEREAVIGDLLEEFETRAAVDRIAARRWLRGQVARSLIPNLRRRWPRAPRLQLPDAEKGKSKTMIGIVTDVKFALRLLRRDPAVSSIAFVSLGAALALNILLFTLANAVLFRPLPVARPSELQALALQRPGTLMHNFSHPDFVTLRAAAKVPSAIIAYSSLGASLSGFEPAIVVEGEVVSGNFFETLGLPLRHGRGLASSDDRPEAAPVVVVSDRFWRDRLGSAPAVGTTLLLNGQAFEIVGVLSPPFMGMELGREAEYWIPLARAPELMGRNFLPEANASWLTLLARIPPDRSVDVARQELDAIIRAAFASRGRPQEPMVLRPGSRGDSSLPLVLESRLKALLAAGVLVLLVACLNVANLQLARTEARRLELAVRSALGARWGQLARLMAIDALLLAGLAAAAGVVVAFAAKDSAAALIALWGRPVSMNVPIDGRVLAASLVLALGSAGVISILSAWHLLRGRGADTLQEARTVAGTRRRAQKVLIAAQFALSLALLTGAALLLRTLDNLRATDLGFETRTVAVVETAPEMARLTGPETVRYFDEVVRRVTALPGVLSAGIAHVMPLDFGGSRMTVAVEGYAPSPDEDMELNLVRVTPGYFQAIGIPILQGRGFDERDRPPAGTVPSVPFASIRHIVVNETMARRYWPQGQAIGRRVRFGPAGPFAVEVVGIVADAHYRMVREEKRPTFYIPQAEWPSRTGVVHVRLQGDPRPRLDELRRHVGAIDPRVPVLRTSTLREQLERNISDERLAGTIGVTLAAATLLLSAAGLYATMAFLVARRVREIGVRMALGAQARDVRRLVLRDAGRLVAVGLMVGVALAFWSGRLLQNFLYGVAAFDAISLTVAAAVLGAAAVLASWLPAARASRVDPLVALRE